MAVGETPSRLSYMHPFREQLDGVLAQAITAEEAVAAGMLPTDQRFAVRIWGNIVKAAKALESTPGARLVWQRDKKDVQVWVKPEATQS